MRALDLKGKRFGRLLVVEKCGHIGKYIGWKCKCDCGNETVVSVNNLQNGSTKSCGCLARELSSERFKKHGKSNYSLYKVWKNIKNRCYNPRTEKYKYYGEKGISMCKEWVGDFTSFYGWSIKNGWKKGLTIDRINVDGNYEPENCRWVTWKTQQRNKSNNIYVNFDNRIVCLKEYSELKSISYDKARQEVRRNILNIAER